MSLAGSDKLFLIGFMGAGKSTVGRILGERLERAFVDMDALIEMSAGRSVRDIFEAEGEETFRERETAALAALAEWPPVVVACGGGVVVRDENRRWLKELGTVVYLCVTAGEAIARVGDDGARPLLAGGGVELASTLLAARETLYTAVADVTVDTVGKTPAEIAEEIIRMLEKRGTA